MTDVSKSVVVVKSALTLTPWRRFKTDPLFYGPKRQQYMMPMVSEGGAWKVNQIAPLPYPVGNQ